MKFDSKLLKQLCNIHSVSGDTTEAVNSIKLLLRDRYKITSEITSYGGLVFGNTKNPRILISAHIDEVGFQVVKQNQDKTFLVNKSGYLDHNLLNNSNVYIQTAHGKIPGTFYANLPLGENNPQSLSEIYLETLSPDLVNIGDFGSYMRTFHDTDNKIMATGLDNKISLLLILDLITKHSKILEKTLFSLVTEEETTNDCLRGISQLFKPEFAFVLDMCPTQQKSSELETLPKNGEGAAIIMAFNKYKLHADYRKKLLPQMKSNYQQVYVDIDIVPEAEVVQGNGVTKAINIMIPMSGWHNSSYTMEIDDYFHTLDFVDKLWNLAIR